MLESARFAASFAPISTIVEIEAAIEQLPPQEKAQLREWFLESHPAPPSALHKLRSLAGVGRNLPEDLAANHDHYLHGTAKRSAA